MYLVSGESAEELLSEASILLLPDSVAFVGLLPQGAERHLQSLSFFGGKVGKQEALEFEFKVIENFRQHKPDMCQWAVISDKGD